MQKKVGLYLFGDSICFGQLVSSHKTWATALAQAVESLNSEEKKFVIQNAGVNGNTTRQALERMHFDVTSHSPDYVVIQFGMNDCNYWMTDQGVPRVSQKAFVANLEEIVKKLTIAGARHCFLHTNHPSNKGKFNHISSITYDESNVEYNELVRLAYSNLIAVGAPVTLFDNEFEWIQYLRRNSMISELKVLLLDDGIHLSEFGHNLYKETIVPRLVAIIRDLEEKVNAM